MSEEQVEVVQGHIDAFHRLDGSALSFLDQHVVLDTSRTAAPDWESAYGHTAVADVMRRYVGAFDEYAYEVARITDLVSGAVLAIGAERGRGQQSGVHVVRSFAALYTVIEGKIARVTMFQTEKEALEAAGLSE
jgi:ketosteroid isomerase-like protein